MIASEKSHQNLSEYNQFLFKKRFEVNKKHYFSIEEMRNSGNCIYDYRRYILLTMLLGERTLKNDLS